MLIVIASAAAGLALRAVVGRALGRALLALGVAALVLGLGAVALVAIGRGHLLGFWTGALVAVVLLGAAALVLPFALAVMWGRR